MKDELDPGAKLLEEACTDNSAPIIKPSSLDVVSEEHNISDKSKSTRKEYSKMSHITETMESNWLKFVNSFKKHLSMMIVFILIGCGTGLYIAKIIYDYRMNEVTRVGGFVHDNKVFDIKLRP